MQGVSKLMKQTFRDFNARQDIQFLYYKLWSLLTYSVKITECITTKWTRIYIQELSNNGQIFIRLTLLHMKVMISCEVQCNFIKGTIFPINYISNYDVSKSAFVWTRIVASSGTSLMLSNFEEIKVKLFKISKNNRRCAHECCSNRLD